MRKSDDNEFFLLRQAKEANTERLYVISPAGPDQQYIYICSNRCVNGMKKKNRIGIQPNVDAVPSTHKRSKRKKKRAHTHTHSNKKRSGVLMTFDHSL